MNEYVCGICGWKAKAYNVQGIVQASTDHKREGCKPKEKNDDQE